eukprot:254032_1
MSTNEHTDSKGDESAPILSKSENGSDTTTLAISTLNKKLDCLTKKIAKLTNEEKIAVDKGSKWYKITNQFWTCVEASEQIDIYQVCSFMSERDTVKKPTVNCPKKYFYYGKAICCFLFQTFALALFIYDLVSDGVKTRSFCEMNGFWRVKTVAVIASTYISFMIGATMQYIDNQGLYQIESDTFKNCPPYINSIWIYIGLYSNFMALFIAFYGSYLVIYFSETSFDVVFNCVAIFFALEIDDFLVDHWDYDLMKEWFDNRIPYNAADFEDLKYKQGKCESCCAKSAFYIAQFLVYLSICVAIVAPVWMVVCF